MDELELVLAVIKDKISEDIAREFHISYTKLLETDAESRRKKVGADIMQMALLQIKLSKLERIYNQIKDKCGNIESIDNYIFSIKKRIKTISDTKNRPLSKRFK